MINEEKLKWFLDDLLIWTSIGNAPDVKKLLREKLNNIFEESSHNKEKKK